MARHNRSKGSKGTTTTTTTTEQPTVPVQSAFEAACAAVDALQAKLDAAHAAYRAASEALTSAQAEHAAALAARRAALPPVAHCSAADGAKCPVCAALELVPIIEGAAHPECPVCAPVWRAKYGSYVAPTAPTARQQRASNSTTAAQAQHVAPVDGVDTSTARYVHGSYAIVARTIAAQGGSTTLAALTSALRANHEWQAHHATACIGSTVCAMRSTRRFGSVLVESIKVGKGAANEHLTLTDAGERWLARQAS